MKNKYITYTVNMLLLQAGSTLFTAGVILRHFPGFHLVQTALALVVAALLFTIRWKWIPAVGVLYGLLITAATLPSLIITMFRNLDPEYNAMREASNPFIGVSLLSGFFALTVLIASIAALMANLRQRDRRASSAWFPRIAYASYGIVAMSVLVSFYLQLHWVTGVNAETLGKLPTLVMKPNGVEPAQLELRAGQPITLQVRNESDNKCHILQFPELNASVHTENGRSGLIVIDPQPGQYQYACKAHHNYYSSEIRGTLTVLP